MMFLLYYNLPSVVASSSSSSLVVKAVVVDGAGVVKGVVSLWKGICQKSGILLVS